MTRSNGTPDPGNAAAAPTYADRVYRSAPGVVAGILLLALAGWLVVDALLTGTGDTPAVALAAAPAFACPVIAYTLRPVVKANDRRLVVRNPLRTITAPWAAVEGIKAGYSVELFAGGRKYQVWALPVSLRQRGKASRRRARADAGAVTGEPQSARALRPGEPDPMRAWADQVVDTLQEQADRNATRPDAAGEVAVTWCWWIIAPTLLGLIALLTVLNT